MALDFPNMVSISSQAIEALIGAIREFEPYRPDPVVVIWLHDPRSEVVARDGNVTRRYQLGQPHSSIFPLKSTRSVPESDHWEVGGLRVIVMPREYKNSRIAVSILAGELIADMDLG